MNLSWCLAPLARDVRAHTPIVAMSITTLLHKENTALLQSCPFLSHNLNLSSLNQQSLRATFLCSAFTSHFSISKTKQKVHQLSANTL